MDFFPKRSTVFSNKNRFFFCKDEVEKWALKEHKRKPRALIIGANNGILADRLTPILMAHEWEGVLIEAVPQLFAELQLNLKKKNGRLWSGLKLVNKALTASESVSSVNISVNLDPNGAAWMRGTGSIVRGAEKRTILTVPAATLPKILQDYPPFDVVQIDVEGFDEVVLQQLESLKWEPLVLALETCNDVCQKYRLAHNFSASDAPGNVVLFKSHLIKKTQTS